MDRITALRARRAGILDQMEALVASIGEGEDMTADQVVTFDALKAEDDKIAADLVRAEDLERRKAAAAKPVAPLPGSTAPGASVAATVAEKGITFARMVRTIAAAGGNAYVAQQIAEANGDSGLFANQNMGSGAAGGFLVPEDVSGEVIELLRPASVVTAMGPRIVPMPNGNLTTNRRVTGATFSYGAEQSDAPATGMTFGQVKLSAKKLRGIIPVSNDLLRSSSIAVDRMIRDDAVADAALIQDRFFLRGAGTEFAPRGLRYQLVGTSLEATNILTMTATPTLQKVTNDLARLELALSNANVVQTQAHWIMSPRSESYLSNLRDGNGNLAFPEMQQGLLRRKPVHVTTEIPDNLGSGSNETEIMLVNPTHVLVGEHMGIEVAMSTEAAYVDAGGTMRAAFSRDETLMRMIMQHDIGLRHLAATAILIGVTWSPAS